MIVFQRGQTCWFRLFQVTILADIEKAFLQVCVHPDDIDALRIVWYKNALGGSRTVKVFRYLRVVFGFVCSPFLLNATIRLHLKRWLEQAADVEQRVLLKALIDSFHVDDLTLSLPDANEAESSISVSNQIIGRAGMRLRKWVTNDSKVHTYLEEKGLAGSTFEERGLMKVLGLSYRVQEDELVFDFSTFVEKVPEHNKLTKRVVLGLVSSVYDPLGLVSPVVVELKLAIQDLWKQSLGWDDILPAESSEVFQQVFSEWKSAKLSIPRQYLEAKGRYSIELHTFSDASKRVCAVACYGRSVVNGKVTTFLVSSKTKLCRLKTDTIPRMELIAALLAARLNKSVLDALGEVVSGTHFWSDSVIALSWIRSLAANRGQFVHRRLIEIRNLTQVESWHYVASGDNPADIPSRGLRVGELRESKLWWQGPGFLLDNYGRWPLEKAEEQQQVAAMVVLDDIQDSSLLNVVDYKRYSKFKRLVQVVEVLLGVLERLKKMRFRSRQHEAERRVIAAVQRAAFPEEVKFLTIKAGVVPSRVRELRLFLSTEGLIRCQTRLEEAEFLSYDARNPILLPAGDYITDLIIMHYHDKINHGSERCTVSVLRNRFWVVKARQQVRRVISKCTFCKRFSQKNYRVPEEANLPVERMSVAPAFTHVGKDFAGHLYLRYFDPDVGSNKTYICLFTCASSRAVHLEVTQSVTVTSFLRAFKRFVARRGTPTTVFSDKGKTFRGASKEVKNFVSFLCQNVSHPGVE